MKGPREWMGLDDDDMLWNDHEEDGDVSIWFEEVEGHDCVDGESDTNWYWKIESDMNCVLGV